MPSNTISEEQKRLNQELHATRPDFGSRGGAGNKSIIQIISRYQELKQITSVLDYGTGKGAFPKNLKKALPDLKVGAYDPAVEKFSKKPKQAFDLVTCFDVLEHVERPSVSSVLEEIKSFSTKVIYLQIDLQPAVKRLSSGRNAHIMLAPHDWWVSQVSSIFTVQGSYPIYHESGALQKIGIVACHNHKYSAIVWSMLSKISKFPFYTKGGYLTVK
ncbi:methyltransferase domain-containing protein [Synechococcus sp. UW69]|uniref:methyltransferase domain-containing protein n=1 Tax=Synechococcus sp. UW69 TaxID=368493 RepID=UPI000E0F6E63|nr:methyltransferase domain-containing protein [Synechococcus sp. UW69]